MTVAELIKLLKTMPQDARVFSPPRDEIEGGVYAESKSYIPSGGWTSELDRIHLPPGVYLHSGYGMVKDWEKAESANI